MVSPFLLSSSQVMDLTLDDSDVTSGHPSLSPDQTLNDQTDLGVEALTMDLGMTPPANQERFLDTWFMQLLGKGCSFSDSLDSIR